MNYPIILYRLIFRKMSLIKFPLGKRRFVPFELSYEIVAAAKFAAVS